MEIEGNGFLSKSQNIVVIMENKSVRIVRIPVVDSGRRKERGREMDKDEII